MSDIALKLVSSNCFDLAIKDGDFEFDEGLETAVAVSLFTDKRVTEEELPTLETDKRGWWGDMFSEVDQDQIGSRIWTLKRRKRTTETLRLYEDYAKESLDWMIEDGVANSVAVTASYDDNGFLQGEVVIEQPPGNESRFIVLWDEQKLKRG